MCKKRDIIQLFIILTFRCLIRPDLAGNIFLKTRSKLILMTEETTILNYPHNFSSLQTILVLPCFLSLSLNLNLTVTAFMVFANNFQRFELGCLRKYNMVLIISPAVFLLPFLTTLIEFWSYVFIYIFFFAGHITDCELLIKFFDKWINTFCHCFNISFSMFVFMIGWYFSCLQNLTHFVQFFFLSVP